LQLQESSNSDKLRYVGIKLMLDGSVQDLTAYMNWPGYYKVTNDLQGPLMTEDQVVEWLTPIQAAGIRVAAHCNGDRAVDVFLDAVEIASRTSPVGDLRHTVEHSQMTTPSQYERIAKLGLTANLFANHLWYYGDQHYDILVGPQRAEQLEAARTALDAGVTISFHTDASVTPLGSLHSMWCAVNRLTPSGRTLGEGEKISAEEALWAVTMGSAYLLGLDGEMGSIVPGKLADFTILEESPLAVEPGKIKDIAVWGTVVGGVKYPSARTTAAA
jgi:predicted amidohydrolase YtcJ